MEVRRAHPRLGRGQKSPTAGSPVSVRQATEGLTVTPARVAHGTETSRDANGITALWIERLMASPLELKRAPKWAKSDRQLIQRLIARDGRVLALASEALRRDPVLVHAALRQNAVLLRQLDEQLRDDPACVRAAAVADPWCFALGDASKRLRADRELVAELVAKRAGYWADTAEELQRDDAFVARCASLNPEVLERLEPERATRLRSAYPAIVQAEAQLAALTRQIGISPRAARAFKDNVFLRELVTNRQHPRAASDNRPLALIVYATDDHNGVLYANLASVPALAQGYRVKFYTVSSDHEFVSAFQDATRDEQAMLFIIGGHGSKGICAFGADDPARSEVGNEERYFDISDGAQLQEAGLAKGIASSAQVMLESCSTGQGGAGAINLANFLAALIPHATIHAPTRPIPDGPPILDAQGRFEAPNYARGFLNCDYVVRPSNGDAPASKKEI